MKNNLPHRNPQRHRFSSVGKSLPWRATTAEIFSRCGIQRKRFSSIVGYNGRVFLSSWDTMEKVFSSVGYDGEKLYKEE